MNGSECLIKTLAAQGIDTLFTNPGTSEIGLIAEIAKLGNIRAVPVLYEGVAAGAADGYFRMTGRPAATILHVGPGLANAWSALHNAAKAGSGVINIVGQLSCAHLEHESPLKSDLTGLAATVSRLVRTPATPEDVAADVLAVAQAAKAGEIATLLMANDIGWLEGASLTKTTAAETAGCPTNLDPDAVQAIWEDHRTVLLLGGKALQAEALESAATIAAEMSCAVMIEWANARCERGGGLPRFSRIPYGTDDAFKALASYDTIVLCGASDPVTFFNHRDKPSRLTRRGARIINLETGGCDPAAALQLLVENVISRTRQRRSRAPAKLLTITAPVIKSSDLLTELLADVLPEGAIFVNESITSAPGLFEATGDAPRHTFLDNRGGSIGFALPVSIGAAIAAPDRKVVALCGDGSAMYSAQALWTIAREKLNVTVLVFANRAYRILLKEIHRATGEVPTMQTTALLRIDDPAICWVSLAKSLEIASSVATKIDALRATLVSVFAQPGPHLVEISI